jgi:translocation and assembly module TamA
MRTTGTRMAWRATGGAWLRRTACLLALLLGASSLHGGRAADPQPYTVAIAPTGDAAVDTAVHDAATLISLQKTAAVGPFALLTRARDDQGRFNTVLQSFGYYAAKIAITVAGRPLDDPNLPGVLDATPAGQSVPVAVTITPGPLFHLGAVGLSGDVPAAARIAFGLKPGAPAVADDVLAARDRLLQALLHEGHALATVAEPVATLRTATQTLDIAIKVDAGPRVDLGPIAVTGLQRTHEAFVRRILTLHQGEQFDPVAIEAARKVLGGVGAFAVVRIDAAKALDAAGQLPMDVNITERPLRSVALTGSYSTDLGGNLSAT